MAYDEAAYNRMKFRLGDYIRCRRFYVRHFKELEILERKIEAAGLSIDYTKPKVKTSVTGNAAYTDWVIDAIDLKAQLIAERDELIRAKEATKRLIDNIEDEDQKDVLQYKYLRGWKWQEIGKVMGYSSDWARHKCYEAVKILAEKSTTQNHIGCDSMLM